MLDRFWHETYRQISVEYFAVVAFDELPVCGYKYGALTAVSLAKYAAYCLPSEQKQRGSFPWQVWRRAYEQTDHLKNF